MPLALLCLALIILHFLTRCIVLRCIRGACSLSCCAAACQGLIYWGEICTELQLGRLANWGSFLPEAPARVPSLGRMLEWMRECFDHVWQV